VENAFEMELYKYNAKLMSFNSCSMKLLNSASVCK